MNAETEEQPTKVWMYCFWIAVAVILLVFVVTVESHEVGDATFNYTAWDKITGKGPSSGEIRLKH